MAAPKFKKLSKKTKIKTKPKKKKSVKKKVVAKKVKAVNKKPTNKKVKIVKKKFVAKKFRTAKKKATIKLPTRSKKLTPLNLRRSDQNPIIKPDAKDYWESEATFNPSALYADGKVHIIYRAIGNTNISVLGYGSSKDGINIDKNSKSLSYYHKAERGKNWNLYPKIDYVSGGGTAGGCEDPRLTLIDGKVYLIYTAFDGWGSVRLALTSIRLEDFINQRWNWREPVLISPPGEIHKNWVLFPEKIEGKFAILHSFSPKILVDYFDSLDELNGKKFIRSNNTRPVDTKRKWDSWFRGVGPSPIKTKHGWLVIYHAMEHKNPDRYRMGAMLLDLKDPTKVLYRSKEPILEPDEWYENEGHKWGVIYSCGAIVKDKKLFVYYGGADRVSCVATADLEKFLKELMKNKVTSLKKK